ncbi:urease accessory protein UreD [Streptomyces sp. NPDC017966]|uniref:urease accessory protein UreD n=1 Tax=unclassified Streptomyces TaxID=2593676 RepID=UPI001C219D68|nr:urease accessory protein UreD [Streptomyces sp. AC558_RSS880]
MTATAQAPAGGLPTTRAHPTGVRATARLRASHNGRATTLPLLHSDGPFHLRRLRPRGEWARVCVLGAMSAPLGGDGLALDVTAGARTRLEVTTSAATIALRGSTTDPATYDVRLTVGEHASLHWLPRPLISTRGSTLYQTYRVELAATSRLLLREEQLLGRTAEPSGHLSTRLTVRRDGRPVLDQHTVYGAPAPAWDGPAVLGGHRATGQLLLVDPEPVPLPDPVLFGGPERGHCVLAPLADGAALLATAVAPTPALLRDLLDAALAHVSGTATSPARTSSASTRSASRS